MGFEGPNNQTPETNEGRLNRLRKYAGAPEGATKEQVLELLDSDGLANLSKDDETFLRNESEDSMTVEQSADAEEDQTESTDEVESDEARLARLRAHAGVSSGASAEDVLDALGDEGIDSLSPDDEDWLKKAA